MRDAANIRPLTSLRFFAALWVVLFHYWPKLDVAGTPALVEKGYLGVELFFVLSGFILCHVYLSAFGEGRFRYGSFLWNRLARVYPLHLATLAGMIVLGVAAGLAGIGIDAGILRWDALPANLLMVQAWGFAPAAAFNHPSWSISAEWFAYLTFPVFAFAAWRMRARPWLYAGLTLAGIALLYPAFQTLTGEALTRATIAWGALRIVPCFALGCAMHGLWRSGAVHSVRARRSAPFFGRRNSRGDDFRRPGCGRGGRFRGAYSQSGGPRRARFDFRIAGRLRVSGRDQLLDLHDLRALEDHLRECRGSSSEFSRRKAALASVDHLRRVGDSTVVGLVSPDRETGARAHETHG